MARPFRFNLERILDLREQLEERAKMELAKATAEVLAQEKLTSTLVRELDVRESAMAQKKTVTPGELWLWRTYRERLLQDIATAKAKLSELVEARERCRRTAVVRSKDRKLLDKLKSNKAQRHALEENLAEQKENDEMASVRYQPPVA
jgi:flagellar protein FliJ